MAADVLQAHFVQIANQVFRDPHTSAKAKGIFGNIATHRRGYKLSPERIAEDMTDGVNAIKTGLRELEARGYLQRTRERRPDGTLGKAQYWITDIPSFGSVVDDEHPGADETDGGTEAGGTAGQHSTAAPANENHPLAMTYDDARFPSAAPTDDLPTVDEPTEADRPPKNTKGKNTNVQEHLSLSKSPPVTGGDGLGNAERENLNRHHHDEAPGAFLPTAGDVTASTGASGGDGHHQAAAELITEVAHTILRQRPQAANLSRRQHRELTRLAARVLRDPDERWTPDALTTFLTGDLPPRVRLAGLLRARLNDPPAAPARADTGPTTAAPPPWCGHCDPAGADDVQARFREDDAGRVSLCPDCHPARRKEPARVA